MKLCVQGEFIYQFGDLDTNSDIGSLKGYIWRVRVTRCPTFNFCPVVRLNSSQSLGKYTELFWPFPVEIPKRSVLTPQTIRCLKVFDDLCGDAVDVHANAVCY